MIKQSMLPTAIFLTNEVTKVVLKCRIQYLKMYALHFFRPHLGAVYLHVKALQ